MYGTPEGSCLLSEHAVGGVKHIVLVVHMCNHVTGREHTQGLFCIDYPSSVPPVVFHTADLALGDESSVRPE